MSIVKTVSRFSLGVFATGLAIVGAGMPAHASQTGCASGYTCLWEDTNYLTNGDAYNEAAFEFYHTNFRYWGAWSGINYVNDKTSSLYNNGRMSTVYMFNDSGFSGTFFSLSRGTGDGSLHNTVGNVPYSGFADELSSGCFSD